MHTDKTPAPMTPSQLLTAAVAHIERHGWIQGNYYDRDGGTCALGALHFAARTFDRRDWRGACAAVTEAEHALADVAAELHGQPITVTEFNNIGCTEEADAICWMQKSAAKLEEHGR